MDLIRREDAINLMRKYRNTYISSETIMDLIPSADKNIGHWELKEGLFDTGENWHVFTCSECGWLIAADSETAKPYHYCPNCGARMVD